MAQLLCCAHIAGSPSPRRRSLIISPKSEHFYTEFPEFLCHRDLARSRRKAELTINTVLHSLLVRVRRLGAFIAASLRKMLGMQAHDGDFASQRVCPSCGLITPRFETCCLECGKLLRQPTTA